MNYINLFFITIFSILLTTNNVLAANWYLATTGSDTNAGTQAAPFLTLQKAVTTAQAGDIINFGVGNFGPATTTRSGTSINPIKIIKRRIAMRAAGSQQ